MAENQWLPALSHTCRPRSTATRRFRSQRSRRLDQWPSMSSMTTLSFARARIRLQYYFKMKLAALVVAAGFAIQPAICADLLKKVADIPLPGGTTRFDYQSLDAATGRLYFSHMGDGELMVFDIANEKLVTHLPGFPTMTGVLVVPALKRVYGSVTKNHEVAVVDTDSLNVVARIPDGRFPDGLAFSPERKKLYVSDESGGVDTVIDTTSNKKLAAIELGGEAG